MKKRLLPLLAFGALVLGAAGGVASSVDTASAQQQQDGLVNVAIGDITIQDVNVGVAAGIAANVCGVKVGPVAVLARQIDASGGMTTVCQNSGNPVVLSQN